MVTIGRVLRLCLVYERARETLANPTGGQTATYISLASHSQQQGEPGSQLINMIIVEVRSPPPPPSPTPNPLDRVGQSVCVRGWIPSSRSFVVPYSDTMHLSTMPATIVWV